MGLDMCFPLGWSFGLDLPDGKWQESSLVWDSRLSLLGGWGLGHCLGWNFGLTPCHVSSRWLDFWLDFFVVKGLSWQNSSLRLGSLVESSLGLW